MVAIVYLLVTIHEQLFFDFSNEKDAKQMRENGNSATKEIKSLNTVIRYNAALLSICLVSLLGFIDDIIELKWRHKLIVPTIATFPLLVAYNGLTSVIIPKAFRGIVGHVLELGFIYRIYMGSLAVFCTNSINIYAGINGIEVG